MLHKISGILRPDELVNKVSVAVLSSWRISASLRPNGNIFSPGGIIFFGVKNQVCFITEYNIQAALAVRVRQWNSLIKLDNALFSLRIKSRSGKFLIQGRNRAFLRIGLV